LLVLSAGLVVVCALGYRVLSKNSALAHSNSASYPEPTAAAASTGTGSGESASVSATLPAALEPSPVAPSAEPALAAAGAETAAAASAPEPSAALKPTPTPSAAASGTDSRRVTVKSKPAKVRFFHFGKQVGVTPFVLEFKPGERHAYEAGLPGYGTRKVVIDGSKPEITIGLRREKP
jgi:hypothetical protein